ncbi:MAG: ABC transporter ATP-binding protein [Opitutales bacterium]|nr:ABC transporter ATP-binding protein [Opitutales bacterium]
MIDIKKISKTYFQGTQRLEILYQLSLKVQEGETLAILGQSGSGKSTLLSLMSGLDMPDFGSITMDGLVINKLTQDQLSEFRAKTMGIVFQQYHLMSNLTALENVGLPLELRKDPDYNQAAMDALKLVGLSHRLSHFPSELSGGECQRVAIARAIVGKPKIILADEPSGNLDDQTGKEVMNLLFQLCQERKQTLILVTHNQELASTCDRMMILQKGQLHSAS